MSDLRDMLQALGVEERDISTAVDESRSLVRKVSKWAGIAERMSSHLAEKAKPGTRRQIAASYAELGAAFLKDKADVLLGKGRRK